MHSKQFNNQLKTLANHVKTLAKTLSLRCVWACHLDTRLHTQLTAEPTAPLTAC